jgi:membrane-associated phospholipid phosphatase
MTRITCRVKAITRAHAIAVTALLAHCLVGCAQLRSASDQRDVVLEWNELTVNLVRSDRTSPADAARDLALVHASMFDAVNSIDRKYTAYSITVDAPPGASPQAAAAAAAAAVMLDRYPKHKDRIDAALKSTVGEDQSSQAGAQVGATVGARLLDARRNDGWSTREPYMPAVQPGVWQPVPPQFAKTSAPNLAALRPFVMKATSQFRISKLPGLDSAEYAEEFAYIRDIGAKASKVRTPDQEAIAQFWLDGAGTFTPPGHWNAVYVELAKSRGFDWRENLRNLALLNLALADSTIIDSDQKYTFNRWRPITAIRGADTIKNARIVPVKDWEPFLPTPNSPAYVSGHSTFAGAADGALTAIFGRNAGFMIAADPSVKMAPRSYLTIRQAAEDAGASRIYGGVHWPSDNRDGLAAGRELGTYVVQSVLRPR